MRLLLLVPLLCVLLAAAQDEAKPAAEAEKAEPQAAAEAQEEESPAPSVERWLTGNIDFGYRWMTDVSGNFNTYRSVVNLGEGPKLFGADFSITDPSGRLFDRLDILGSSWGGDPYNTARINAEKGGVYRLLFDYRNIAYFNFLPSFGNPDLDRGSFLDQRSFDTRRRMMNSELELRPGSRVVPYFGFMRDAGDGSGISVFESQGNEYPVRTAMDDHSDRYRAGVRIQLSRYHLTLEQGGTRFDDNQSLFSGERNPGNRRTPYMGQQLVLDRLDEAYRVTGNNLFSRIVFTAQPVSWANVFGRFLYNFGERDIDYTVNSQGNFINMAQLRFYSGMQNSLTGESRQPRSSGSFGFELRPIGRLRIMENVITDRSHVASSAVLAEQVLLSGTPGAVTANPFTDRMVYNFNQQEVNVFFDPIRSVTLRGGHRYVWGDASIRSWSLSPTDQAQAGELRRHVGIAGLRYRPTQKLTANADFEASNGARNYFRTSLQDYYRLNVRARYQLLPSLNLQANFSYLDNQNPAPTIDYDFRARTSSLSVQWLPKGGQRLSILGTYTRSTIRSDLTYLLPQMLVRERSFYQENSHSAVGLLDLRLPAVSGIAPHISVGGSMFTSFGNRPTRYYQPVGRFLIPIHRTVHWYSEWRHYGLSQPFYTYETFRTHMFVTGFRLNL